MPNVLRTLLAPVLLVQGRRMFAAMPRLEAPAGPSEGATGDGPPLRLLIVGDSSAAGYGVDTTDESLQGQLSARLAETHRVAWATHARFGSTVPKTLRYLRRQDPRPVDLVVVAVGMNDMIAGAPLDAWLEAHRDLAAELRARFRPATIVVSGMPPIGGFPALPQPMRFVLGRQRDRYDAALKAWADGEPDLVYVPTGYTGEGPLLEAEVSVAEVMAADGFHPGPRVYAEWSRRVVDRLRSLGRLPTAPGDATATLADR